MAHSLRDGKERAPQKAEKSRMHGTRKPVKRKYILSSARKEKTRVFS